MPVPGGKAHEIWASDLARVGNRSGLTVLVPVFALDRRFTTVLGLILTTAEV
jgi:hypothetical protein